MKTWKKVGITALAGSMVALSAQAVDVAVTGSMVMTYTGDSGTNDAGVDGGRWGMSKAVALSGSGEMDNGWTVSLTNSNLQGSAASISIDMGDAGTFKFQNVSGGLGIGTIDDMMPTANEEVWDGMETAATGRVGGGDNGFQYSNTAGGATFLVGYAIKGDAAQAGGGNGSTGSGSDLSFAVKFAPMDGLNVGGGVGTVGTTNSAQDDDHDTIYATYAIGSFTVGVQQSNIDYGASGSADEESTAFGISFAVNDDLSISYGQHNTDDTGSVDEEVSGVSVGYSMGGMTVKAHKNSGDGLGNTASQSSEHTEIAISWAF
jgi:outer membrane protein OmpU